MADSSRFSVTFYGVRGTMPLPSAQFLGIGGNTSCVGVRCGERQLVFDCGTGLYPLGEDIQNGAAITELDLFLSHTHIDHIFGIPFFGPAFRKEYTLRFWAGHLRPEHGLRDILSRLVSPPIFPLGFDDFKANLSFHDFTAGAPIAAHLQDDGINVTTLPLAHPDRATAYRVVYQGHAVCYVTDVEHRDDTLDEMLVEFVRDADMLIYDSTFDDAQFSRFVGWGHSTWQHALRIGRAANVKQVALFHHDPSLDDAALLVREAQAKTIFPGAFVAREKNIVII